MRLKRVLELQDKGLSIRKIAVLLGLSERTVKRDLAKAMPFLERRRRHQLSVCYLRRIGASFCVVVSLSLNESSSWAVWKIIDF